MPKTPHLLLSLFLAFGAGAVQACGGGDDACIPGKDCTCADESACSDSCDGQGCRYTCTNTQSCTFDCAEGGCNVAATNAGTVTLDCPGGGCQLACTGSTSCQITNCTDCTCTDDKSLTGLCGG